MNLKEEARDALKEAILYEIENNGSDIDEDDIDISGLADDLIPVYTVDLLALLADDYDAFGINRSGQVFDDVESLIVSNCYEYLYEYLYEIFDDVKEEVLYDVWC